MIYLLIPAGVAVFAVNIFVFILLRYKRKDVGLEDMTVAEMTKAKRILAHSVKLRRLSYVGCALAIMSSAFVLAVCTDYELSKNFTSMMTFLYCVVLSSYIWWVGRDARLKEAIENQVKSGHSDALSS